MEKLISEFSLGLFFWQTLIFLGLLFLLRKFAWRPIMAAVQEREDNIENSLKSAEQAKKEMEELQAKNQDLLKEAREERDKMLKEAKDAKDRIVSEAKTKAKEEADKLLAQARQDIHNEKQAAVGEMKQMVASFSVEIAEKIMKEELAVDKHQKLVNTYLEDLKLN